MPAALHKSRSLGTLTVFLLLVIQLLSRTTQRNQMMQSLKRSRLRIVQARTKMLQTGLLTSQSKPPHLPRRTVHHLRPLKPPKIRLPLFRILPPQSRECVLSCVGAEHRSASTHFSNIRDPQSWRRFKGENHIAFPPQGLYSFP